jgi:hypothetical protein
VKLFGGKMLKSVARLPSLIRVWVVLSHAELAAKAAGERVVADFGQRVRVGVVSVVFILNNVR